MKALPLLVAILAAMILRAHASEASLSTIYQPLDPMVDGAVVVREVPFVTGGAYPEVFFNSITRPHIPQQSLGTPVGDINVASRAGISITCESAAAGQKKLYVTWDFSKANPELVNEDLIKALLKCLEKTAGKSIGLYSKFIAAEKFPEFRKLIEKRFPPQTEGQLKEHSP
jgi:DNA integrity scanning protein DisA with diadenylate cyclase activity